MSTPVLSRIVMVCAFVCVFSVVEATANASARPDPWSAVVERHVQNQSVDYQAMKSDPMFTTAIQQFTTTDPAAISNGDERLAFWINAYNAFTVKLVTDHFPVKSIKDVEQKPWDDPFITIHDKHYSLNQIENEILRKEFHEPRVHFTLVCAAKGCPQLRYYNGKARRLDLQLEESTKSFLGDRQKNYVDWNAKTIYLSPIFDWYKDDFIAAAGSVQKFVRPYFHSGADITANTIIKYTNYDWSLNGR